MAVGWAFMASFFFFFGRDWLAFAWSLGCACAMLAEEPKSRTAESEKNARPPERASFVYLSSVQQAGLWLAALPATQFAQHSNNTAGGRHATGAMR